MGQILRICTVVALASAAIALCIIAYKLTGSAITRTAQAKVQVVDYTNIVVILLTTVTVIFSVFSLALAVLGVIGFRNLKRDAGRYATQQTLTAISSAFKDGGPAIRQIESEFTKEDGHLKKWANRQIRQEVITLLPLVVDRFPRGRADMGVDEDAPTDEGEVD